MVPSYCSAEQTVVMGGPCSSAHVSTPDLNYCHNLKKTYSSFILEIFYRIDLRIPWLKIDLLYGNRTNKQI